MYIDTISKRVRENRIPKLPGGIDGTVDNIDADGTYMKRRNN